jgi:hypothetical protein
MKTFAHPQFSNPKVFSENGDFFNYNSFLLYDEGNTPRGSIDVYAMTNPKGEILNIRFMFFYRENGQLHEKIITTTRSHILNSDVVKICPVFIPSLHIVGYMKIA